ncbi:hypothetical protein CPB85DRAFT_1435206 [Mucidula mucida]|nr:hypothetical protein CPB85DRAFT_1435206 [Mucidula mucida]
MPAFEPRSFPPPSLAGVPVEYIIEQLHTLAPGYWNHPETADCTLLIPIPHNGQRPSLTPDTELCAPLAPSEKSSRRASEPFTNWTRQITMKLHTDYLFAHSKFLCTLFSDASPIDLINPSAALDGTSVHTIAGSYSIPRDRLPRLMPSSAPSHPVLFLPVPDPSSLPLLIHWMYFGDTDLISDALEKRQVQWEGIARNVEYLGLPSDIKVFLGRWYGKWLNHDHSSSLGESDSDDSDTAFSDSDEDMMDVADSDSDTDVGTTASLKDESLSRGRDRATRCLSWTSIHSSSSELSTSFSPLSEDPCETLLA